MNTVYTYYEPVEGLEKDDHQKMITHWRRSWAKQGWNPVVIGKKEAEKHPFFEEYSQRILNLPTVNPKDYEVSCFYRWLAVACLGGGFLSDYDVVNYGFKPRTAPADLVFYETNSSEGQVTPSVVGGSAYGFITACMGFSLTDPNRLVSEENGHPHASDMISLQKTCDRKYYLEAPVVKQYGAEGWATADLVHYAHSVTTKTDRASCMINARPI